MYKYKHWDGRSGEGLTSFDAIKNAVGADLANTLLERALHLQWQREPHGEYDEAAFVSEDGEVLGGFMRS